MHLLGIPLFGWMFITFCVLVFIAFVITTAMQVYSRRLQYRDTAGQHDGK